MITIVHRIQLKPGTNPEEFERWVKQQDYATCPDLPSVRAFAVHRVAADRYFEVIEIESKPAFEADMQTPQFAKLVERFTQMAEVVDEIEGERVEPGFHRA